MQKSISMTFGFAGVCLLGFRVQGLGLGSGLRPVPHKVKNLVLRSVTTFFFFLQSHICAPQVHTGTPHIFCHTTTVIACVFVKMWTVKVHVYTHGLDMSVVVCSQLPSNSCNHTDIPDSSPHRYPTHILWHNHCHRMCICQEVGSQKPLKITLYTRTRHFSGFMISTSAKVLES